MSHSPDSGSLSSIDIAQALRGRNLLSERITSETRVRELEDLRRKALADCRQLERALAEFEPRSADRLARLEQAARDAEQRAQEARVAVRGAGMEAGLRVTELRGGIDGAKSFLRTTASSDLLREIESARLAPTAILSGLEWFGVPWGDANDAQRSAGAEIARDYLEEAEKLLDVPGFAEQASATEALVRATKVRVDSLAIRSSR